MSQTEKSLLYLKMWALLGHLPEMKAAATQNNTSKFAAFWLKEFSFYPPAKTVCFFARKVRSLFFIVSSKRIRPENWNLY